MNNKLLSYPSWLRGLVANQLVRSNTERRFKSYWQRLYFTEKWDIKIISLFLFTKSFCLCYNTLVREVIDYGKLSTCGCNNWNC